MFVVPASKDIGVIGPMLRATEHCITITPSRRTKRLQRKRITIGYPVHSRCWKLAERVIGPSIAEKDLAVLMQILHQRFWDSGFGTPKSLESIEYGGG